MFSRSAGCAVQALTYLAQQPPGKLTGAREIAEATQIPRRFLWKILRHLSERKLLRSFKGVRGEYEPAKPARRIVLADILKATQGNGLMEDCVLGRAVCDERNACPLHSFWMENKRQLEQFVKRTSLANIAGFPQRTKRG